MLLRFDLGEVENEIGEHLRHPKNVPCSFLSDRHVLGSVRLSSSLPIK